MIKIEKTKRVGFKELCKIRGISERTGRYRIADGSITSIKEENPNGYGYKHIFIVNRAPFDLLCEYLEKSIVDVNKRIVKQGLTTELRAERRTLTEANEARLSYVEYSSRCLLNNGGINN